MDDRRVEEGERVAAAPRLVVLVKVAAGKVTCDRRNGKVDEAWCWRHAVGKVVVLDPGGVASIALVERGVSSSRRNGDGDVRC